MAEATAAAERDARDKLAFWDRRPDTKAPLTERQRDSVLELKAAAENLPVPVEVRGELARRPLARASSSSSSSPGASLAALEGEEGDPPLPGLVKASALRAPTCPSAPPIPQILLLHIDAEQECKLSFPGGLCFLPPWVPLATSLLGQHEIRTPNLHTSFHSSPSQPGALDLDPEQG